MKSRKKYYFNIYNNIHKAKSRASIVRKFGNQIVILTMNFKNNKKGEIMNIWIDVINMRLERCKANEYST